MALVVRGRSKRRNASRNRWWATTLSVVLLGTASTAASAETWQSWSYDAFWAQDRSLADPGALYAGDEPNVYATTAYECVVWTCAIYWVPRYTSTSMAATAGLQPDAMPDRPAWVSSTDRAIWAPSVIEIDGAYVMYFGATAGSGANADMKCVGAAVSSTPAGPFAPWPGALVCASPGYWALDPYVVSDGTNLYLLWREDDASHVRGKIVAAQLTPNGLFLGGAAKRTLLVGEYAWEDSSGSAAAATEGSPPDPYARRLPPGADGMVGVDEGIGPIENPAMARHPATGEWLLTWSANRWETQDYATGLAVCDSPLGPCERISRESPWLRTGADASIETSAAFGGAGGLSFVVGPDLQLYAVFHAYRGTADNSTASRIGWAYRVDAVNGTYRLAEF
jgi:hypothetical protein